jgi:transcriptional regulator with XRE-family HTH domain
MAMKNNNSIREQLGITQESLAILLGVTRSQLSLYELGKRNLPVTAKVKLAEMLTHVQATTSKKKAQLPDIKTQVDKRKIIEELLFINKRKQMLLEKESNAIEKKEHSHKAALHLADYLFNQESKKQHELHLAAGIASKTTTQIEKKNWELLFKNQIKKELLQKEDKYLQNKLQKLQ